MSLHDKLRDYRQTQINAEKAAGIAFMLENRQNEGVVEGPMGMQYKVLQEGSGDKPALQSMIKAHYAGRLLNGTEFDSSFKRGVPFTARITQLIKGWQEVLPMMSTGSRWIVWIPSDLAYGDAGASGGKIPGGATLEFEIELLEILS
jgi:FKBP-type peptidyl-prolyl cis-trans isomerase FklB